MNLLQNPLFLAQRNIFSILGYWSWLFLAIIAAVIIFLVINRKTVAELISSEKPRFRISDAREFEKTFSENPNVKRMIENGEGSFITCSHCKHLDSCNKCSKIDYDIDDTVCGDYEL